MKLRNIAVPAFLFLALALQSCGSVRRAGKDLTMAVATPVMMLYGGGVDATASAQEAREGTGGSSVMEVIYFFPAFVWHSVKHGLYGVAHALDFVAFPFYAGAELHPYGPEIKPLDIYSGTWFDLPEDSEESSGTDPESGAEK